MPASKSDNYHQILDHLDSGHKDAAVRLFYSTTRWTSLTEQEFRLLLNRFIRDGVTVRTA